MGKMKTEYLEHYNIGNYITFRKKTYAKEFKIMIHGK